MVEHGDEPDSNAKLQSFQDEYRDWMPNAVTMDVCPNSPEDLIRRAKKSLSSAGGLDVQVSIFELLGNCCCFET